MKGVIIIAVERYVSSDGPNDVCHCMLMPTTLVVKPRRDVECLSAKSHAVCRVTGYIHSHLPHLSSSLPTVLAQGANSAVLQCSKVGLWVCDHVNGARGV